MKSDEIYYTYFCRVIEMFNFQLHILRMEGIWLRLYAQENVEQRKFVEGEKLIEL